MSTVIVNKFGNSVGVSEAVQQYVTTAINDATAELVTGVGASEPNQVPRYTDTTGKKIEGTSVTIDNAGVNIGNQLLNTDFYLPLNRGTVGQVMTMFNANSSIWSNPTPAVIPTYVNTLTVTDLAQGTSSLNQNYIFPDKVPPVDGNLYALTGQNIGFVRIQPATINVSQNSTFSFLVLTTSVSVPISFALAAETYTLPFFINFVRSTIAGLLSQQTAVTMNFTLGFDTPAQRFFFTIIGASANFVGFNSAAFIPSNYGNVLLGGNVTASITFVVSPSPQFYLNQAPTYIPPFCFKTINMVSNTFGKRYIVRRWYNIYRV